MALQKMQLILARKQAITPSVTEYVFRRDDGQTLTFTPGQFVNLTIPTDNKPARRSYSIATVPSDDLDNTAITEIAIAVSPVEGGIATRHFDAMQEGDLIDAMGPAGRLVFREDDKPKRFILIATGTGVSPYRAMLPQIRKRLAEDDRLEVHALLGVQRPSELLYGDDFVKFMSENERFHFHACYSREMPNTLQAYAHSGRVQVCLPELDLTSDNDLVYLCGNPQMIDESFAYLQKIGFTPQQVRREKYFSGK